MSTLSFTIYSPTKKQLCVIQLLFLVGRVIYPCEFHILGEFLRIFGLQNEIETYQLFIDFGLMKQEFERIVNKFMVTSTVQSSAVDKYVSKTDNKTCTYGRILFFYAFQALAYNQAGVLN